MNGETINYTAWAVAMSDKLDETEARLRRGDFMTNASRESLVWLIAEVHRLRWFEIALHHVLGGGACPWCLGEEAHHEETHKPGCEYIAHKERA